MGAACLQPKEVRIGCHIAEHDRDLKLGQARGFLGDGYPLRLVVTFTGGREIALGAEMAQYLVGKLGGEGWPGEGWARRGWEELPCIHKVHWRRQLWGMPCVWGPGPGCCGRQR